MMLSVIMGRVISGFGLCVVVLIWVRALLVNSLEQIFVEFYARQVSQFAQ